MELTHSPQLNDLIKVFQSYLDGHADVREVLSGLSEFQKQRRALKIFFSSFIEFETKGFSDSAYVSRIQSLLEEIKKDLSGMESALKRKDKDRAKDALQAATATAEKLYVVLEKLKQEEDTAPRSSKIPMIHQIVRLGKAVSAGTFPREKFGQVIEKSLAYHDAYYQKFKEAIALRSEPYGPRTDAIRKDLKVIGSLLRQLKDEVARGAPAEKTLSALAASGDALQQSEEQMAASSELGRRIACVKCGELNPAGSRYCAKCNAVMPKETEEQRALVDVTLVDGGVHANAALVLTSTTEELKRNVERFLKTAEGKPALTKYLDGLKGKAKAAAAAFAALPVPIEIRDEDARESFQELRGEVLKQFSEFQNGIGRILAGIEEKQPDTVRTALGKAIECGSMLAQMQMLLG